MKNLLSLLIIFSLVAEIDTSFAMEDFSLFQPRQTTRTFKLGIELQGISGLCPDMKDRFSLQKKPIFFVYSGDEKLWELQIDGDDIEFVTQPFFYNRRDSFIKCLKSIICAVQVLRESSCPSWFTFQNWIKLLSRKLFDEAVNACLVLKSSGDKFIGSQLEYSLKIPRNWSPHFAPQVTIQHPLEWSIPLYAYLFQQDSLSPSEVIFDMAIPLRREWLFSVGSDYKNKVLQAFISNKIIGLMFLNAFVIASMAKHAEDNDYNSIKKIFKAYMEYGQFDAKMQSDLVSRRPFSQMCSEVVGDLKKAIKCFNELSKLRKECAASLLQGRYQVKLNELVDLLKERKLSSFHKLIQEQIKDLLFQIYYYRSNSDAVSFREVFQYDSSLTLEKVVSQYILPYLDKSINKKQVASNISSIWKFVINCLFFKPFNDEYFAVLDLNCFIKVDENRSYKDIFDIFLSCNSAFAEVPVNFGKVDYGEQYYDDKDKYSVDLRFIYRKFHDYFKKLGDAPLNEACYQLGQMTPHQVRVNYLLGNGILTLSMLRNLDINEWDISDISNNFYANVLSSINNPEAHRNRKVLNLEKARAGIIQFDDTKYPYDYISPPLFLDTASDAMGHYKDIPDVNKYGEAVVEVRTVSDIGAPCLRKMNLDEGVQGNFLKDIDKLEEHALALFEFLGGFRENILEDFENLRNFLDISIGKAKK